MDWKALLIRVGIQLLTAFATQIATQNTAATTAKKAVDDHVTDTAH